MPYKDGGKSGGRKPGSKNKLTLAIAKVRADAMAKINDELGDLAFKGDAVEFLQAIYKSPHFDPEMRKEAAKDVAQFERAKKTESTIEDKTQYVCRMPAPVNGLDEWKCLHMSDDSKPEPADPIWTEKLAQLDKDAGRKHDNEHR